MRQRHAFLQARRAAAVLQEGNFTRIRRLRPRAQLSGADVRVDSTPVRSPLRMLAPFATATDRARCSEPNTWHGTRAANCGSNSSVVKMARTSDSRANSAMLCM